MAKPTHPFSVERDSKTGLITALTFKGRIVPVDVPVLELGLRNLDYAFTYQGVVTIPLPENEFRGLRLSEIPTGIRIIPMGEERHCSWPGVLVWRGGYYAYYNQIISRWDFFPEVPPGNYVKEFLGAIAERSETLKDIILDGVRDLFEDGDDDVVVDYRIPLDPSLLLEQAITHAVSVREEIDGLVWLGLGKEKLPPKHLEKPIGIFLSHSSRNKNLARKLAADLRAHGIRVWLDEAEMLPGDSLIRKLEHAIHDMDYLCVILSPEAVESEWVQREVEIALHQEIEGKLLKVIPLLYKKCDIPGFLQGKIYADCTTNARYKKALKQLICRVHEETGCV